MSQNNIKNLHQSQNKTSDKNYDNKKLIEREIQNKYNEINKYTNYTKVLSDRHQIANVQGNHQMQNGTPQRSESAKLKEKQGSVTNVYNQIAY